MSRSDATQNSKTASKKIASQTPQIASPFHTLESEQTTSEADDSNVGSNIDEDLGKDIRGHLHILEKINLAESFSEKSAQAEENFKQLQKNQKLERRKIREQKVLASAIVSDTEGYLTPGTFLKRAVLKTTQAEVAASVLKGFSPLPEMKKLSAAERDVEDFTRIAERKRTQAREASLAASKAKKKAATTSDKTNVDQENDIYVAAEEAWRDTVDAYEAALKKAINANFDITQLTAAYNEAIANVLYWHSAALEVSAKKLELNTFSAVRIKVDGVAAQFKLDYDIMKERLEIESAWHTVQQGYQEAIIQSQTGEITDAAEEWIADLRNAEQKKDFWRNLNISQKEAALAQVRAEILKREEEERADQEKIMAQAKVANDRVVAATAKIEEPHANVVEAERALQEAPIKATDPTVKIREAEEKVAALSRQLDEVSERVREAHHRAESQKYSFCNAVGISHSKRDALEDERRAAEEVPILTFVVKQARETVAKLKREDATAAAEKSLKANVSKTKVDWHKATKDLEQLKKEEGEAIRLVSLTPFQRQIEKLRQFSIESKAQGTRAIAAKKTDEGDSWNMAGWGFTQAAEKLEKAIEAEVAEKLLEGEQWRKIATLYQQSVDLYTQAARAHAAGKTDEGNSWNNAGQAFYNGAEKLGKALEAEAAGKPAEASKWSEAAVLDQQSVDLYTQAARAHAAGKTDEGQSWHNAGNGFCFRADKLVKVIEAEAAGKPAEAAKWSGVAELQQQSVELCTQAARAYKEGKTDEGNSWNNAGQAFYWGADKLAKAIQAETAGKPAEAAKWREASVLYQRSVELYTQAARAKSEGKTSEGASWNSAALGFYGGAEKLGKAVEAAAAGKRAEEAKWSEAAALQQCSVKPFIQSARAYAAENYNEGVLWNFAGLGFHERGDKLGKALEAEAAGKGAMAAKWREAAALHQRSVEPCTQAIRATSEGKTDEGKSWHDAGIYFFRGASNLGKAIEAEAAGRAVEGTKWREAAEKYQEASISYIRSAEAYKGGNKREGKRLYDIGAVARSAGTSSQDLAEKLAPKK